MSEIDLFESKTERRRLAANIRLLAGVVVLGIAIAVGVIFVFRFADAEYDRDLQAWQVVWELSQKAAWKQLTNGWKGSMTAFRAWLIIRRSSSI